MSIRSGHGVGKTTLEAWLILWFLLTRKNCKIPVAANSQDQLRDTIWPEIAKWHRQLPDALKAMIDVQAERIVVVQDPEGAFAVRRTASKDNPEALQGFHAEHLLFLIDEASGIDDIVFEVGMGALSTPGAKVVMAGNPTRTSGFFYDTHHQPQAPLAHDACELPRRADAPRGTSRTSRPSMVTPATPIVCACWVSSPRRMTRPLSHWSWCSGRWDGTCQLSTIIQSGAWTLLASETTARRLQSDKRTSFWSR